MSSRLWRTWEAASDRFTNPEDADATKTACAGAQAVCVSVKREKKTEQSPPRLTTLTTLQRRPNRLFGFPAKQSLDYAQQLYEKKLLTYPPHRQPALTDDMQPTAEKHRVRPDGRCFPLRRGWTLPRQFGRVLEQQKGVRSPRHYPHAGVVQKGFDGLTEGEKKLLSLVCCKLLCAVAAPHVYEAVTATSPAPGTSHRQGQNHSHPGWKEIERRFKASFKTDADEDAPELARELPEITGPDL